MPTLNAGETSIVLSTRDVAPGVYESPVFDIGPNVNAVRIRLARNAWPNTGSDVLKGKIFRSTDNGQTWIETGGFSAAGGVALDKFGGAVAHTFIVVGNVAGQPKIIDAGTKLKSSVEVFSSINTQVELGVS